MRISLSYFWIALFGAVLLLALATSAQTSNPQKPAGSPSKPDLVEATLAAVEAEYEQGRVEFNANHLQAAREHFNRAFDLLLTGPVEVKSNERLQREFDRVVDGIHEFELAALQDSEQFPRQQPEPAPIDEANSITYPVDPSIKAKAEQEVQTTMSDLPLTLNDAVASYINYFSSRGGRSFLEHGYIRSGRYREMIVKTLRDEGLPQDLIYLAQAESGFHPLAVSRAGARGMWQFMAGRAEEYGLRRNGWFDERQDPIKATRAAAHHLKDLFGQFGDWYLVMAAYNSGPGTVQHAVERTGYADYWELYRRGVLPAETRNYVPIILAITIMSKNPAQYGLERLAQEAPLASEGLTIHYAVDLRLVAECADAPLSTLQELNPSLLRFTTPKDESYDLRLPVGAVRRYEEAIAAIPAEKRTLWRYHRVLPGDTLASIALQYHTPASVIVKENDLTDSQLRIETKLIIPVAPSRRDGEGMAFSKSVTRYQVRKGDTVQTVADDFEVPVESLRRWNRLKGNTLTVGRTLVIHRPQSSTHAEDTSSSASVRHTASTRIQPEPAGKKASAAHAVVHRVKKGETLASIANEYNVSVGDLRRNNGKLAANLRAGDLLVIKPGE
ncbi:MAG: LysM peptidoglycan-binding domain-containing protein [Terriglobales bacterium]